MMTKIKLLLFFFITFYSSLLAQPFQSNLNLADSLSIDSTTVNLNDSLSAQVKGDTLKPLYYMGYLANEPLGISFTKTEINKNDFRFIGDVFNYLPYGMNADLGSVGNPSEVFLYGLGFNNISFLTNGIDITNRYQNALDLNLFQTEHLDLIEVPSLASGFIYNNRNNPISVNFISKNRVNIRPYSRIRFYQASENEGAFDGQFSAYAFKRVNISFGISNQSADSRYKNSELSNWQFNTQARYMPSNTLNIIAGYSFVNLNMDLNGGVDILSTPDQLYSNIEADVNFLDRYRKTTRHNFSLSSIFEIDSISYTNLSLYYQYNLDEFRHNESTTDSTETKIVNNNSYKTYGVNIHQRLSLYPLALDVIGNYEYTDFDVGYSSISSYGTWALGGKLSTNLLSDKIMPSLFSKISGIDNENYFGIGGEIKINLNSWLSYNAGVSYYSRDLNRFLNPPQSISSNKVSILETGIHLHTSLLKIALNYFSIQQSEYTIGLISDEDEFIYQSEITDYSYQDVKRNGANLDLEISFWKLLVRTNSSIYFGEPDVIDYSVPTLTSFGGLYYVDTLFNENLDLKAGINYKFYGERGYSVYDLQRMQGAYNTFSSSPIVGYNSKILIANNYQLDLFVAGTIRKRATVYLVFENLLSENYYVAPYYPIQPQGFRFGVAWEFLD